MVSSFQMSHSQKDFSTDDKSTSEELEDVLPPYSNSLRLLALCQRKREFNASFDKARRRTWEVIWLLLDGTALRIYSLTKEERRRFEDERMGTAHTSISAASDKASDSQVPNPSSSLSSLQLRSVGNDSIPVLSASSVRGLPNTAPLSATSLPRSPAPTIIPSPDLSTRIPSKQYPVRNAVCLKADSYLKREHVLRFILDDGKQFLVQLNNRTETISWLQNMAMAAPLALDLDERPMPEPAQYPRSRRRPRSTPATMEPVGPSTSGSPSPPTDNQLSALLASASVVCIPLSAREAEEEEDSEAEMDHLPPPITRPPMLRSLSSVDQARRLGIQI